ncbi:CGNR zinc finger domain-containing protein [Nonomuraea typhae]|uniref:CGNR zinc finger domain-containing protein n=1 Tax=Nonomuraea typhae TaxID=2603600 RepID=UPI001FE496A6|nr:CGNR zinc finger domain-containing protein [Nonomuraea typhae]
MTVTIEPWRITGQSQIDSYVGRWAELAVVLVNTLAVEQAQGRARTVPAPLEPALEEWRAHHHPPRAPGQAEPLDTGLLGEAAAGLRPAFGPGPVAGVAELNALLLRQGAVPNLHAEPGQPPVLAFHAPGAGRSGAMAADAGTALAMVIGVGQGERLATCRAQGCELVFFDTTRNASRRFCGLACQNRAKAAAYRARRGAGKA